MGRPSGEAHITPPTRRRPTDPVHDLHARRDSPPPKHNRRTSHAPVPQAPYRPVAGGSLVGAAGRTLGRSPGRGLCGGGTLSCRNACRNACRVHYACTGVALKAEGLKLAPLRAEADERRRANKQMREQLGKSERERQWRADTRLSLPSLQHSAPLLPPAWSCDALAPTLVYGGRVSAPREAEARACSRLVPATVAKSGAFTTTADSGSATSLRRSCSLLTFSRPVTCWWRHSFAGCAVVVTTALQLLAGLVACPRRRTREVATLHVRCCTQPYLVHRVAASTAHRAVASTARGVAGSLHLCSQELGAMGKKLHLSKNHAESLSSALQDQAHAQSRHNSQSQHGGARGHPAAAAPPPMPPPPQQLDDAQAST